MLLKNWGNVFLAIEKCLQTVIEMTLNIYWINRFIIVKKVSNARRPFMSFRFKVRKTTE